MSEARICLTQVFIYTSPATALNSTGQRLSYFSARKNGTVLCPWRGAFPVQLNHQGWTLVSGYTNHTSLFNSVITALISTQRSHTVAPSPFGNSHFDQLSLCVILQGWIESHAPLAVRSRPVASLKAQMPSREPKGKIWSVLIRRVFLTNKARHGDDLTSKRVEEVKIWQIWHDNLTKSLTLQKKGPKFWKAAAPWFRSDHQKDWDDLCGTWEKKVEQLLKDVQKDDRNRYLCFQIKTR